MLLKGEIRDPSAVIMEEWEPPLQSCLKGNGTNSCEVASILALKPHLSGSKGLAYFWNLLIRNL